MGVAAQSAGNRAMTGTVYNLCYVNSLWYRSFVQRTLISNCSEIVIKTPHNNIVYR